MYTIIGNKLAPWLAERYLASTAVDGQQTGQRFDGTAAANLFEPVDDDHDEGARGGSSTTRPTRAARRLGSAGTGAHRDWPRPPRAARLPLC